MKEWTTVDKTEWPRGEWNNEPDKAQWIDEESGLDCLIVRGPSGALCGYVGVPPSHPLFDKDYSEGDSYGHNLDCHGGITFSARCDPSDDESRHICHSGDVANKLVYWFGFDCNHIYDLAPGSSMPFGFVDDHDTYRDLQYVKGQTTFLAKQLMEIGNG